MQTYVGDGDACGTGHLDGDRCQDRKVVLVATDPDHTTVDGACQGAPKGARASTQTDTGQGVTWNACVQNRRQRPHREWVATTANIRVVAAV